MIYNKVCLINKCFQYFIAHKDYNKMKPLYIMLPKMSGYSKSVYETKYMVSFVLKEKQLLKVDNKV